MGGKTAERHFTESSFNNYYNYVSTMLGTGDGSVMKKT